MANRDWLMVLDFDGTVTTFDVAVAILEEFAEPGWQLLDDDYDAGRITLAECIDRQFGMIRADRETLRAFARDRAVLRPGFRQFVDWCRETGVGLMILSAGLDVYIEAVLERERLGADSGVFEAIHCVRTEFGPTGLRAWLPGEVSPDADYKRAIVESIRAEGRKVAYAGDGSTDRGAAAVADLVFARSSLLRHCRSSGIACMPFESFDEVRSTLADRVDTERR